MFTSFEPVDSGENLFMGNSATSEIQGQGKVILKITFGKTPDTKQCVACA